MHYIHIYIYTLLLFIVTVLSVVETFHSKTYYGMQSFMKNFLIYLTYLMHWINVPIVETRKKSPFKDALKRYLLVADNVLCWKIQACVRTLLKNWYMCFIYAQQGLVYIVRAGETTKKAIIVLERILNAQQFKIYIYISALCSTWIKSLLASTIDFLVYLITKHKRDAFTSHVVKWAGTSSVIVETKDNNFFIYDISCNEVRNAFNQFGSFPNLTWLMC